MLQIKVTNIISCAPLFFIRVKGLVNKSLSLKLLLNRTKDPKKIIIIPKLCVVDKVSPNKNLEKTNENKGE